MPPPTGALSASPYSPSALQPWCLAVQICGRKEKGGGRRGEKGWNIGEGEKQERKYERKGERWEMREKERGKKEKERDVKR